jgi:hypothetical protein
MRASLICSAAVLWTGVTVAMTAVAAGYNPYLWREFATKAEWRKFDGALTLFTSDSALLVIAKNACHIEPSDDEERFHFVDVLVKDNLLQEGAEADDQRRKFDAMRDLNSRAAVETGCKQDWIHADEVHKQQDLVTMLGVEAIAMKRMILKGSGHR